jgi:hypothetical protein
MHKLQRWFLPALALIATFVGSGAEGLLLGAVATYSVSTSHTDLNAMWRKVQGDVALALQFESEEWDLLGDMDEYDIDWSAREITIPVDIIKGVGIAKIPEGGYEARPSSPNLRDLTITWSLYNGRFSISKTAKWIDQSNREAMLTRQIVQQGKSKMRALASQFSDDFYGFSTGILCDTSTGATQTNGVYTIEDAYGVAGIDDKPYLDSLFEVGDYVALIRSAALVTNAIGVITAKTAATPSLTITWAGSVDSDANDSIVKANSMENATLAGTDYNRGLVGLLDALTSSSVHSLTTSTEPNWNVAYADTTAGRFSGIKLHRAKQEVQNEGPGKVNLVFMSQGVERDVVSQYQAGVRFEDSFGMEIDGSVKSKGIRFFSSRRVPPGYVAAVDKRSCRKMTLIPKPDQPMWDDGEKIPDISGFVFPIDYPVGLVWLARKNLSYFSGQVES